MNYEQTDHKQYLIWIHIIVFRFCDSTDAYYYKHVANALRKRYQKELENRKQKIKHLRDTAQLLNDLR